MAKDEDKGIPDMPNMSPSSSASNIERIIASEDLCISVKKRKKSKDNDFNNENDIDSDNDIGNDNDTDNDTDISRLTINVETRGRR